MKTSLLTDTQSVSGMFVVVFVRDPLEVHNSVIGAYTVLVVHYGIVMGVGNEGFSA
jgi:hypothetical protein